MVWVSFKMLRKKLIYVERNGEIKRTKTRKKGTLSGLFFEQSFQFLASNKRGNRLNNDVINDMIYHRGASTHGFDYTHKHSSRYTVTLTPTVKQFLPRLLSLYL